MALSDFTAHSGVPKAPEQLAVVFEHVGLSFRVDPVQQSMDGDAVLTFQALKPFRRLVFDLDRKYVIRTS